VDQSMVTILVLLQSYGRDRALKMSNCFSTSYVSGFCPLREKENISVDTSVDRFIIILIR
jgi:hypothetical protein